MVIYFSADVYSDWPSTSISTITIYKYYLKLSCFKGLYLKVRGSVRISCAMHEGGRTWLVNKSSRKVMQLERDLKSRTEEKYVEIIKLKNYILVWRWLLVEGQNMWFWSLGVREHETDQPDLNSAISTLAAAEIIDHRLIFLHWRLNSSQAVQFLFFVASLQLDFSMEL